MKTINNLSPLSRLLAQLGKFILHTFKSSFIFILFQVTYQSYTKDKWRGDFDFWLISDYFLPPVSVRKMCSAPETNAGFGEQSKIE